MCCSHPFIHIFTSSLPIFNTPLSVYYEPVVHSCNFCTSQLFTALHSGYTAVTSVRLKRKITSLKLSWTIYSKFQPSPDS